MSFSFPTSGSGSGGGTTGPAKLLATSGAVTWDPNVNPIGAIIISANVTSIAATVPASDNLVAQLILVGDGTHTWCSSISGCALVGGTFTGPAGAGSVSILNFVGLSSIGSPQWKQLSATATGVA